MFICVFDLSVAVYVGIKFTVGEFMAKFGVFESLRDIGILILRFKVKDVFMLMLM